MIILVEKNSPFFDVSKAEFYFAENRQNLDDVNGLFFKAFCTALLSSV